jgi:hypothetical protein
MTHPKKTDGLHKRVKILNFSIIRGTWHGSVALHPPFTYPESGINAHYSSSLIDLKLPTGDPHEDTPLSTKTE